MNMIKRLQSAASTGEIVKIIYHGGTQPGASREVVPFKVVDETLHARCCSSNTNKTFKLDKVQIYDDSANKGDVSYDASKAISSEIDEFIAIDVETANAARASICQVGMARYKDGKLTHEWKSYVDPEDHFDGMNISIHGITENTVKDAPNFPKVAETIRKALEGRIVACHSDFDRASIARACEKYDIPSPNCTWLDTARVARRAWIDDYSQSGYGLASVCHFLDYNFGHHDALEDAKAAGHVLLCAIRDTGISLSDWKKRVLMPIGTDESGRHTRSGNVEGALFGEVLVFTGALEIPRRDAADLAAKAGCDVASGVNKKTTIVVVGDQDIRVLADGADKSNKHRKAEELIAKGQHIRIIGETDFLGLLGLSPS